MDVGHSILKKRALSDPNSFAALRKEGIRLVQKMSGDVWTDYNLHDPGVTILEQLCFALTDLIYRSDFTVEDQLTGEDGKIAYGEQALHLPEDILPCRPSTAADYRQLILDSCPDVDNVWIDSSVGTKPKLPSVCPGVHAATVRPFSRSATDSIKANVKKSYAGARNLCEDIHESIIVLEDLECCLIGTIEIDGSRAPSELLGQIYHRAVVYIASNVNAAQQQKSGDNAEALIEMYTGPRAVHGRARLSGAGKSDDAVLLADLVGILQDIQGVVRVHKLALKVLHPKHPEPYRQSVSRRHGNAALWLRIPRPGDAMPEENNTLCLVRLGRLINTPIADTWNKFYQLITADRSSRMKHVDSAALYTLPAGVKRNFRNYYSIQNHFPDNYGINSNGVPASAPAETRARARQLKAYLMLFEQIIANHLANVDGVRELFANAGHRGPTYRYQVLSEPPDTAIDSDKDYKKLYIEEKTEEFLSKVLADVDDSAERKSRQLDNMLAVFGESHSQKSLRQFDYYSLERDPYEEFTRNKKDYLSNIVEVTRDRVGGADYSNPDSVGGFARRVGLLLGFHQHGANLVATMQDKGVDPGVGDAGSTRPDATRAAEAISGYGVPKMRLDSGFGQAWRDAWRILRQGEHAGQLLLDGTNLENYRLVHGRSGEPLTLKLGSTAGRAWQSLARFKDEKRGQAAANVLHHCAIALCRKSEGLHVVEHVLLRPAGAKDKHTGQQPDWDRLKFKPGDRKDPDPWQVFYALRFSVFFPAWTARCRDPNFRLLAEETVRMNSPAHVYGQCFWLDYGQMCDFETLAGDWAHVRRQSEARPSAIDECAVKLIDYVLSMQESVRESKQVGHD